MVCHCLPVCGNLGLPWLSPIQVLTKVDPAYLLRSDETLGHPGQGININIHT